MQWSLLHFPLSAFTAVCSWSGKPQGRGVRSSISRPSIASWVSHFQMETIQSVLLSVCLGDWMASIDLRKAYLQVPVHPESRPFLRFVANGQVYQFKALCFSLSTAPQVFTPVMAPVSAFLHSLGIRMRCYLDDWLVQSYSRVSLLCDLQAVLDLCRELGIVVNPERSNLVPSQVVLYLGVVLVKEARATTRRDHPFQGSWKAYPWYLSHFLALLPFYIKRGIF